MLTSIFKTCIVLFFCYDYYYVYSYLVKSIRDISVKQSAYIMSTKSTFIMFICGLYFNGMFYASNFDIDVYINSLGLFSHILGNLFILNFMAYLIMDCIIGYNYYPNYMNTLAGYIHHNIYIIINICSLYNDLYPYYLLFMISELPSVILNVGSFEPKFRSDMLFGTTFFITRIVYHIYLTYIFFNIVIIRSFAIPILCIHIYWFKNWVVKYLVNHRKTKN